MTGTLTQQAGVAVTRRGPDAGPGPAWIPEERVELVEMLAPTKAESSKKF